jgi:hypothetical protein
VAKLNLENEVLEGTLGKRIAERKAMVEREYDLPIHQLGAA